MVSALVANAPDEQSWFLDAVRTGQVKALMEVLAPDVVLVVYGGGLASAARALVHRGTAVPAAYLRDGL
ncbi:hypothetical protein [Nonomuraea longispora]|uniref:hypothetical protein n=1 Tax=Nonomuraea longispora TaxID=1848320 RepID=UPI0015F2B45E|nr:hypothetical protein [Nonomuraea longispora]